MTRTLPEAVEVLNARKAAAEGHPGFGGSGPDGLGVGQAIAVEAVALVYGGLGLDWPDVEKVLAHVGAAADAVVVRAGLTPSQVAAGSWMDGLATGLILAGAND